MRYLLPILFCTVICGQLTAAELLRDMAEPAPQKITQEELKALAYRTFNIAQRGDAPAFADVASEAFLKTAALDQLRNAGVNAVNFFRGVETAEGEAQVILYVALSKMPNGAPNYDYFLHLSFIRKAGQLKLIDYEYSGC